MARLESAYERTVIGNEGPYDNDPKDPGGETVFGITRKYQGSWPGWALLDAWKAAHPGHTEADIVAFVKTDERMQCCILEFYEKGPWAAIRGNEVDSQAVAEELFDSGVNCGMPRAIKWLQRALNVFNRAGADYPDIEVDGYMGNQTLECLNSLLKRRGAVGERVLLRCLNAQQGMRYLEIAEANPTLEAFEVGWWDRRVS
jgi:lysozyme family protein